MEDLKYPIGKYIFPGGFSLEERKQLIKEISSLPSRLRKSLEGMDEQQFQTTYRPEGWTVRQLVNHISDSHINAFVRFKLALTEDNPIIKPYIEDAWVRLADTIGSSIETSLALIDALHQKWVLILDSLVDLDFKRTVLHPESGEMTVEKLLGLYAWHGNHHLAHITRLKERMNWN
jgi:uncharacterized damage-inducible protein DinB